MLSKNHFREGLKDVLLTEERMKRNMTKSV